MQDDIAYMKSLAQAGERSPLKKNGASLFWAGLVFGLASVTQYASVEGYLPRGNVPSAVIWGSAIVLFFIISAFLKLGRPGNIQNVGNRAAYSAWSGVGLGCMFFLASMIVMAFQVPDFNSMSFLFAPVFILLYGIGWWVSGQMSGRGWLKLVALGCFVSAPMLCLLAERAEQLLAYGACLILFATLPGLILMREKA
jgi:hypothetical protein